MIQSVLVYTVTLLSMMTWAAVSSRNFNVSKKSTLSYADWFAIIIFAVIFGIRYNVGIDYANYTNLYFSSDFERTEFLFRAISELLCKNDVHIVIFFTLWAFLQIFFVYQAFKQQKWIYPFLLFTLFCGQYFLLWMNVIRQDIAACIFIFSISYVADKKIIKYLVCCFIALGFHKSAAILFLVYPLFQIKKEYFKNRILQLFILFFAIIFGVYEGGLIQILDSAISLFMTTFGYEGYGFGGIEGSLQKISVGSTFLTRLIINIITVLYSKKVKSFFSNKDTRIFIFYDLFFFGIVMNYLLSESFILLRIVRYFNFFGFIITAYLLYYLYKNYKQSHLNKLTFWGMIVLYVFHYMLLFTYSADTCYMYNFIWEF